VAGFLYSWTAILIMKPAAISGVSMAFANYVLEPFFPGCQSEHVYLMKMVASLGIGVILFVNCASVRWATVMQVVFTAAKLIAAVMLIITGFVRLGQGHNQNFQNSFVNTTTSVSRVGYAFYGGLWAYDGWNNLNYVTEELKNPIRDLPLAIMVGIPFVTACYVMINIAYLTVMSSAQIAASDAIAVTLANQLYGAMAWIIPVLVACSTFGAANGSAFTSGRLVYVAAREGHMPKLLAMIHRKRHTPLPALIFTCIVAWIMLIPESTTFQTLVNYFNFASWTFYGATIAALLWLRYRQPDLKRPYKVFIGIPVLVLLAAIYLVLAPFYDNPLQSFYAVLFILLGLVFYVIFVKYQVTPKPLLNAFAALTYKLQVLADLSMPVTDDGEGDEEEEEQRQEM
jgi:L-type amino acid transporter 9